MKKVLIVACYFGTRVPGLIGHLPEFGWQPVLLTTALPPDSGIPPEVTVIETGGRAAGHFASPPGRSVFNRLLTLGGEVINYPDAYRGWRKPAVRAGDEILESEKIDAVISSSAPVTAHLIARELKDRHGLPWLADLRDLWSQNHNYYYSRLRKRRDRSLECKTLSAADALVTVSRPWADRLGLLHEGRPIYAVTNGFDAEAGVSGAGLSPKFLITYTGNIYAGKQHPARLFAPLRELISEGDISPDDAEVRFYGHEVKWLQKEIERSGLAGIVRQCGVVPQPVAAEKQSESQLLWLMDWDDPAEDGWYPLKIFEYLGAGRPVLATGGVAGNAVDRLLQETGAGVHAVAADSTRNALRDFYREYRLKGEISYHGIGREISRYTHREMARKFADILGGLGGQ